MESTEKGGNRLPEGNHQGFRAWQVIIFIVIGTFVWVVILHFLKGWSVLLMGIAILIACALFRAGRDR